jgi:hypothetical protein
MEVWRRKKHGGLLNLEGKSRGTRLTCNSYHEHRSTSAHGHTDTHIVNPTTHPAHPTAIIHTTFSSISMGLDSVISKG